MSVSRLTPAQFFHHRLPGVLFAKVQSSLLVHDGGSSVAVPSQPAASVLGTVCIDTVFIAKATLSTACSDEKTAVPRAAAPGIFRSKRLLDLR